MMVVLERMRPRNETGRAKRLLMSFMPHPIDWAGMWIPRRDGCGMRVETGPVELAELSPN